MGMEERLSITDVAKELGVTPRTIMRWEKAQKIKKSKRDWRGWRFYLRDDLSEIRSFYERAYDYDEVNHAIPERIKDLSVALLLLCGVLGFASAGFAASPNFAKQPAPDGIRETRTNVDIVLDELPAVNTPPSPLTENITYTLGPDDIIAIEVRNHPEFSGEYTINSEGKIEYKYIGDVLVSGLTKNDLKERLMQIISEYIISPDIHVRIVAYLSKVFYVVGEVRMPGKFYMKGDVLNVREALVQAGLPTESAAMRRCRLITPNGDGKENYVDVDVYSLLYEGNMTENAEMKPGDVLYVPATAMAKFLRVLRPATNAVGETAGAAARGAMVAP